MMSYEFSFLFPFLLLTLLMQSLLQWLRKSLHGWRVTFIICTFSLLVCIVPVEGMPLARWLISLNANFSIPLTAVLLAKVWEKATGKVLFDRKTLSAFWLFGIVMGLLLYPMALGLGPYDPYSLGWKFSLLFVVMMVLTIFLLLKRNRLGIVLMLCILAYHLRVLESSNFWDYLIDPFFVIVSCFRLLKAGMKINKTGIPDRRAQKTSAV
ncbi:MAG TPA: hypothetical protein VK186_04535 [Candidatus Deferrimicrobium sp.]|nr:hypothetical protein [Candidatus Deferrimicrobium sp.]